MNKINEIPDTPPPALPETPPPDTLSSSKPSTLRRSPSPFSGPEKPPRIFTDAHSPNGSKTSRDSSPTPSSSFQTPPESLQITDVNATPSSAALEKSSSSTLLTPPADVSSSFSSSLSPPEETSKRRSATLSHLPPSDAPAKPSPDSPQPPSGSSSAPDAPKRSSAEVPTVSVVPADGDAAADEVFLESGDQSTTVLLRKPSQRRKEPGQPGNSKLKRVVSARIDRIGSVLSRLLDRDKGASAGDQSPWVRLRPALFDMTEIMDLQKTKSLLCPMGPHFFVVPSVIHQLVPNDELEFHEPRCPYRVYNCLINVASGVPCKWEGRRVDLEEHVAAMHPRYYSAQETTKWRWSPNLLVKMEDFQLISAFGELFWYCAAQDPERLRVCWFVQHIGYDQDSLKYEFRFAFTDEEKDRRLELACTTLPDYSSVGSIVESGRCLDMSYQQALSFVDEEGTIKFSVTIYKLE
ncbi:Protein of unknown function [Gryllus bimaculatus]|nr:Protein of unknown function [Gryllus bimaculatus]